MSTTRKQSGKSSPAGNPGDGAGRTDNTQSQQSGVWPASGPLPEKPGMPYQGMASFGQGERGAEGFQDSGQSEIQVMPPDGESSGDATGSDA